MFSHLELTQDHVYLVEFSTAAINAEKESVLSHLVDTWSGLSHKQIFFYHKWSFLGHMIDTSDLFHVLHVLPVLPTYSMFSHPVWQDSTHNLLSPVYNISKC